MMNEIAANILAIVLAFVITIVLYNVTGLSKKYTHTDKVAIPLLFGVGGLLLFLLLRWIGLTYLVV